MVLKPCRSCGELLQITEKNRQYCDIRCRQRLPIAHDCPVPKPGAMIMNNAALRLRELIRKLKPSDAKGWVVMDTKTRRLYPLPGRTKRFRGNLSDTPYYVLEPYIELPRVPEIGQYCIIWFLKDGTSRAEKQEPIIMIDFSAPLDRRHFIREQHGTTEPLRNFKAGTARLPALGAAPANPEVIAAASADPPILETAPPNPPALEAAPASHSSLAVVRPNDETAREAEGMGAAPTDPRSAKPTAQRPTSKRRRQ